MKRQILVLSFVLLGLLVLPYYIYSTYFYLSCWAADGQGSEAGYRCLGMLTTMQWVYWESLYGTLVAAIGSAITLGILRLMTKRAA